MSVLVRNRNQSKIQYTATANFIFDYTLQFMSRLSARYGRLLNGIVMKAAAEMLHDVEMANGIYPNTEEALARRKQLLIEANAALGYLDVLLGKCYDVMMKNPQGCFMTPSKKAVPAERAVKRLDSLAQHLGEAIDAEHKLIRGVLRSDAAKFKSGKYAESTNNEDDDLTVNFDVLTAIEELDKEFAD